MAHGQRRIRVGIDTGGTFTDVVAFDEDTGELVTTKTPSTPANPADGFIAGIEKILGVLDATGDDITAVCHGTTVATNKLLEGKVERLGFITTEGYEFMLEIARQAVPDGYGNSYFWVKPPRIVAADHVRTVRGRMDFEGNELRPFDEADAVAAARWFRDRGITTIGVCFLHSYANDEHELAMREVLRREHPDAVVSISTEVLREYREYERSMTTLVDAAVKPNVSRYVSNIHARLDGFTGGPADPVLRDEVQRRRALGRRGRAPADHDGALRARRGGPGGGTDRPAGRLRQGADLRRRRHLDRRLGRARRRAHPDHRGHGRRLPQQDPDDRRRHGGRGWRLDRLGHPRGHPQGGAAVGRRRPRARSATARAAPSPPSPTPTSCSAASPRTCSAARSRSTSRRPGAASVAWPARLGLDESRCATGILEISAWNQANALRQVSVKRGLDVRDFMLTTFGGSGSLLACRLVDILDLAGVVVPQNPGNVSAFGLLTVDVKNDYVQTHVARHATLDHDAVETVFDALTARATTALDTEGFPREQHDYVRTVDLRYFGQAYEVRVPAGPGPVDAGSAAAVAERFHDEHRQLYGYDFRDDPRQQVEWVNLRVTGVGPITRPELREIPSRAASDERPARARHDARSASTRMPGTSRPTSTGARTCGPATPSPARRSSRSSARRCRCTPASPCASTRSATSSSPRRRSEQRRPAHGIRARQPADAAGQHGRPDPRRDRAGHPGERRDGGRDRHRPHLALADDPRRARLPGRHPRPPAAQADRALVLGARAPHRA